MIKLLIAKIGGVAFVTLLALVLFLWQSNRLLIEKNKTLNRSQKEQIQTIAIQKKVLAVVKNTKTTNLAGNLKRMQDGEL
mgnify:CR=1 FL=1